jgi:hypothetical protein
MEAGPLQRGRQIDLGGYLDCRVISGGRPLAARATRFACRVRSYYVLV